MVAARHEPATVCGGQQDHGLTLTVAAQILARYPFFCSDGWRWSQVRVKRHPLVKSPGLSASDQLHTEVVLGAFAAPCNGAVSIAVIGLKLPEFAASEPDLNARWSACWAAPAMVGQCQPSVVWRSTTPWCVNNSWCGRSCIRWGKRDNCGSNSQAGLSVCQPPLTGGLCIAV